MADGGIANNGSVSSGSGGGNGSVSEYSNCPPAVVLQYNSSLGVTLAVPEWEAAMTAASLSLIILLTVVGNILVILSVFTYKPLRIVQNFFIVSLAVADLTVALLVLPFNVAYSILGRWEFGMHMCKTWLTFDVMCCTASILNLCAIALDRYWAITDPINYAQKRTLKRVLMMISGVWILSLLISSPPLIGWNDWPAEEKWDVDTACMLTRQQGYVVYSSLGSFYIPLFIMTIVYIEIFIATKRRLRERARASKINTMACRNNQTSMVPSGKEPVVHHDQESVSSETNHNEHPNADANGKTKEKKRKKSQKKKKKSVTENEKDKGKFLTPLMVHEDSVTDNPDNSSGSQKQNQNNQADMITIGEHETSIPKSKTTTPSQKNHPETPAVAVVNAKKPGAVYQFIEEKQRISLSKERRAARTLGIIMGVFVVCWLPFFLMYVIVPFCPNCCPTEKLINFITWLGYINSALNPIIYTIFNLDFRRAFKKLLGLKH